jgi:hypothetical protein
LCPVFRELSKNPNRGQTTTERTEYPNEMVERDVEEPKLNTEAHNCVYRALDKETQSLVVIRLMCHDQDDEEGLLLS